MIPCLLLLLQSSSFCLLIMSTERDDSFQFVSVRLDGKNYLYWSYVMRNFSLGQEDVGIC
jgi:hypothetical protein